MRKGERSPESVGNTWLERQGATFCKTENIWNCIRLCPCCVYYLESFHTWHIQFSSSFHCGCVRPCFLLAPGLMGWGNLSSLGLFLASHWISWLFMSHISSQSPEVPEKLCFRLPFCVSQPPTKLKQNKYIIMMIQKIGLSVSFTTKCVLRRKRQNKW